MTALDSFQRNLVGAADSWDMGMTRLRIGVFWREEMELRQEAPQQKRLLQSSWFLFLGQKATEGKKEKLSSPLQFKVALSPG